MIKKQNDLGEKLKLIRGQHKLTVEQLAERSQCSAVLIEKLEAGALIPSLTPLLKIARGLGVRLGTFLDDSPHAGPSLVRQGQADQVLRFSGNADAEKTSMLDFHSLAAGKSDRHMEPFMIEVHPPQSSQTKLSGHEGEEFLYVLKGGIEILYGKEVYQLSEGDSIYYDSVVPHSVHALNNNDALILAVVYSPA